jgi:hypothetical protein
MVEAVDADVACPLLVALIAFAPEEIPLIEGKIQGPECKFH